MTTSIFTEINQRKKQFTMVSISFTLIYYNIWLNSTSKNTDSQYSQYTQFLQITIIQSNLSFRHNLAVKDLV